MGKRIDATIAEFMGGLGSWTMELAVRFSKVLKSEYEKLRPIDASLLKEEYPDYYNSLLYGLKSLSDSIIIIRRGSGIQVTIDENAKTEFGVRVLDLAYIIENGLPDWGVQPFLVFSKAKEKFLLSMEET